MTFDAEWHKISYTYIISYTSRNNVFAISTSYNTALNDTDWHDYKDTSPCFGLLKLPRQNIVVVVNRHRAQGHRAYLTMFFLPHVSDVLVVTAVRVCRRPHTTTHVCIRIYFVIIIVFVVIIICVVERTFV